MEGLDILGCAQTGTGKTAAFALPILDYIGREQPPLQSKRPTALVLAPTRELAQQISDSFRTYGKHMRFRHAVVYGGVGQAAQTKALGRGLDVLIATPGRLIDLMDQGFVDLGDTEILVLDEADRMLDMGFMPALKKIVSKLPEERQSLFFSATLPPKIRELASRLLFNPVTVTVTPKSTSVEKIEQSVRFLERTNKLTSLNDLLEGDEVERAIVFTRTKHGANGLAKKLHRAGFRTAAIHGNKTQNARQRSLEAFRRKQVTVLVATDVAARGIDIDGVTHVVNYDMPVDPESYVHRIGRTGRAGADGIAVSFCTADEMGELRAIERLTGKKLRAENPSDRFDSADGKSDNGARSGKSRGSRRPNRPKSKSRSGEQRNFRRNAKAQGSTSRRKRQKAGVS